MTKESQIRLLRIYSLLLSLSIVAAGICLIGGCLSIYNSGDSPYSREAVALVFSKIAIPVYLCLCLTIIGFVLDFCFPVERKTLSASKDLPFLLKRLHSTRDTSDENSALCQQIAVLERGRKPRTVIRTVILITAFLLFLSYALNMEHYHASDINASMIKAMFVLIPCLIAAFLSALYTAVYNEKSMKEEMELLKQLPNAAENAPVSCEIAENANKVLLLRLVFFVLGIGLVIYGAYSGGIADVLAKAINICTECIGLG